MSNVAGYGIPTRIDGPPPIPPRHSLLSAAAAKAPEVRIVPDTDPLGVDRWGNGVQVYGYPTDIGDVWDECQRGSTITGKGVGNNVPQPYFGAFAAYITETCLAASVFGNSARDDWPDLFAARARMVLGAVESAIVERELMTGRVMSLNPHLSDATDGVYPLGGLQNAGSATSVVNAVALLELAIAQSGRAGVIHCTPAFATVASAHGFSIDDEDPNVLRTRQGTLVIPGAGYAQALVQDHSRPHGQSAPAATQEWVYATGPIEIRRSEVITLPESTPAALWQAIDRSLDVIEYRAERYYLVDWDTAVHSAVLVDRCQETC